MSKGHDWRWIDKEIVLAIHGAQIIEHGGDSGLRDAGLLESALARAKNAAAYGDPSPYELAALYAASVCKNHPFVDGNKRVSLVLLGVFLDSNGYELTASEVDAYVAIMMLASGEIYESELATWIEVRSKPQ